MQSHSLGRTSLTGWTGDQPEAARKHMSTQAEIPKSLDSMTNTGLGENTFIEEDVTVQEFNHNLHFASSVQPNTPAIDAQERGVFRNRVTSHHHDGSELFLDQT